MRDAALAALFRHLNPLHGGPDGTGWPFGRPVQYGEVFGVLQRATGDALVEDIRLFPADPITGRRGAPCDRIDVAAAPWSSPTSTRWSSRPSSRRRGDEPRRRTRPAQPAPIGEQLPALYADDDFAQRFTAGLDTVLAPVFSTLDNLPAYLDPRWLRRTS